VAAEDRMHRRGGEVELPADRVRAGPQLLAGRKHGSLDPRRRLSGRVMRPARAVGQPFAAAVAADPLRRRLARATRQPRRGSDRLAPPDQLDQTQPLAEAESSISMNEQEPSLRIATRHRNPRWGSFSRLNPSTTSPGTTPGSAF